MNTFNEASVQYGDFRGTVAADDGDPQRRLDHFAKANGVDTDKYYPIAVSFYSGEGDFESVAILALDKSVAGGYEEIQEYAKTHDGKIPAVQFDTDAKIADLLTHFKRFDARLVHRSLAGIEIEYDGEGF